MRIFELGVIGLLIILIITNLYVISSTEKVSSQLTSKIENLTQSSNTKSKTTFKTSGIILDTKPNLPNYISNSDFIFPESGWLSDEAIPPEYKNLTILKQTYGWKGNGYLTIDEMMGRKGIIYIHPISEGLPRYIETPEFLLPDSGFVVIGFANKEDFGGRGHGDNVFKVYLIDTNKKLSIKIDEFVISNKDGWKDIAYPIKTLLSEFSNKKVKVRVESWAGGEYAWYGEWGIVDYIDVIS
jgi:hypothetical protein